jgi:hypothetical protein
MRRDSPGATKRTPEAELAAVTTSAGVDCGCAGAASYARATPHKIAKVVKAERAIRAIDMIFSSLRLMLIFRARKARHTLTRKPRARRISRRVGSGIK